MEESGRKDTQEYQPSLPPSSMSCDMGSLYKQAILEPSFLQKNSFKTVSGPFKNPARLLPSLSITTEVDCSGQNNTTLFVHGLKLWYHVLPSRKLHSSGNLAITTMNLTSLAIFLLFLVFPLCTFLLGFILWVSGSDAGWEAAPGVWDGRACVQPFPPSRTAAGIPFSANPNLLAGVWRGEASATPCSWQVRSPLGQCLWLC